MSMTIEFTDKDTSIAQPFASCTIMDRLVDPSVILENFYEH